MLVLLVLLALVSSSTPRCINEQPPEEPKYFYYGNQALSLRILVSERLTHQITSTILKVFVEEVLGYFNVTFVEIDDVMLAFDPDTQFSYISSCTDYSCQNLDHLPFNSLAQVPRAMVDMEMWLPPNFQVNDWQVEDVGRLGPGGRFGWFIPASFASTIPPIKDHWRAFTNQNVSRLFAPSQEAMDYITPRLKNKDGE